MRKLYSSEDRVILHILESSLTDKGIVSYIKNDEPPLAGEIPRAVAWPELWVMDDAQYAAALNILEEELAKTSGAKPNWRCPQCHEMLEGQFDICWKCGHSR